MPGICSPMSTLLASAQVWHNTQQKFPWRLTHSCDHYCPSRGDSMTTDIGSFDERQAAHGD